MKNLNAKLRARTRESRVYFQFKINTVLYSNQKNLIIYFSRTPIKNFQSNIDILISGDLIKIIIKINNNHKCNRKELALIIRNSDN